MRRVLSVLSCAAVVAALAIVPMPAAHAAGSGLTVTSGITTTDLVASGGAAALASSLVGPGVQVSKATFTGANAQGGLVSIADPALIGFNTGVIMSSGNIADIAGPNASEGTTGDMAGGQDADLTALISGSQTVYPMTYDTASLEFDFVPNASTMYFTYVFASEEYLEWVNLYNDVFAFFVTDANGHRTNCALTQDSQAVSIDTINDVVNPSQFRPNGLYYAPAANPINIESDGVSVELICQAPVTAGQVNHMKLAIADTSDQILDSVVMIKSHSLSTTKPEACNNAVEDDGDGATDMSDADCQASTQPAPVVTNSSLNNLPPASVSFTGVGANYTTAPFTGAEGAMIPLDAAELGMDAAALDSLTQWNGSIKNVYVTTTAWTLTAKPGTTGTCAVVDANGSDLAGLTQPLQADGNPAIAYAVCTTDGQYTARVDAWDNEGGGATDTDVDFTVANAAPVVQISAPVGGSTIGVGETLSVTAALSDQGADDTITGCDVAFGDGTSVAGSLAGGVCSASHIYSKVGTAKVSVAATDSDGDTGADAVPVTVDAGALTPQTITATPPASASYGSTFTVSATGGASGNPLSFTASGGCTASGATYTMTSGTADCVVTIDQAGDAAYAPAPTVVSTVAAATRAITVTANAASKTVGQIDPSLTYGITSGSLVTGDTLSGALTRAPGETVGTYAIAQGTLVASADYALTFVPGVLTIKAAVPTITSLSPTSGGPGTAVTITGSALTGATSVTFNGKAARFTVLSPTSIVTSVPASATTGAITVVTPAGTAKSASFTASTKKTAPTVTGFSPTSGTAGTTVTVTGTNLAGATSVKLGTVTVTSGWTILSATQLSLAVPAGTGNGTVAVTTDGGTGTSSGTFTVPGWLAPTTLAYSGTTSATKGAAITLKATLAAGTTKVAGALVTFTLNGSTYTATTSSTGVATVSAKAPAAAGKYPVVTAFAGNAQFAASTSTATLTVK